ncbi:hypothetical protein CDG81_09645 [Actinopolyspora erythraea]|uniref:DUF3168 domain-containing protein n=1 Tax=Actinopolyspora erythraea TaxID=414996 RepID=A0A099D9N8_9ACTN|nr:hypothetical protein [Actinopolyspora erythraea]ASU78498.1 hypothetical protein CDG81_09645 [Actinopolyspora erythraea]KGI82060.1 hypothetical protein IL38_06995 [Actinopolyspora erythraea]
MTRTAQEKFLNDILLGFVKGNAFHYVGKFTMSPLIGFGDYPDEVSRLIIIYSDEEEHSGHSVTTETVAKGLNRIADTVNDIPHMSLDQRNNILFSMFENDASHIDDYDCNAIVEVGLFGEVRY